MFELLSKFYLYYLIGFFIIPFVMLVFARFLHVKSKKLKYLHLLSSVIVSSIFSGLFLAMPPLAFLVFFGVLSGTIKMQIGINWKKAMWISLSGVITSIILFFVVAHFVLTK